MGDPRPFSLIFSHSLDSRPRLGYGDDKLLTSCGAAGASCRVGGAYGEMEPVVGVVLSVLGALNVRCCECAEPIAGEGRGEAAARRKPTR